MIGGRRNGKTAAMWDQLVASAVAHDKFLVCNTADVERFTRDLAAALVRAGSTTPVELYGLDRVTRGAVLSYARAHLDEVLGVPS